MGNRMDNMTVYERNESAKQISTNTVKPMKAFKGKAIYNPSGKAAEYAAWACNFYVGCSNGCEYCYCKKGMMAGTMGGDTAVLKKCFRNREHAIDIFFNEIEINLEQLQEHGLFFSFTTDPLLPETRWLTGTAIKICISKKIPVKVLTKCTDWITDVRFPAVRYIGLKEYLSCGFTLTGHDELELGASSNYERMIAMKKLHDAGFKTWASIEPIIDFNSSFEMIANTNGFCDLYKIGLKSGTQVNKSELVAFINGVLRQTSFYAAKVYFKDSLLKQAGITREELNSDNCVGRDYKLHEDVLSAAKLAE